MKYDLLSTVEYGGCSAKLPAAALSQALAGLPATPHPNLLVDIETHDDAGVYKINDELALIQTTDFFSPVCSDPFEFGQIAAANALSDVYAMGGEVLTALNIVAFPANVPLDVLHEILRGGIQKVIEAGGVIMGGHTIVDDVPKYGLAVTGIVHPEKIITNAAAIPGDVLILTKPLSAGIIMAGQRIGEVKQEHYQAVLESMKQLNKAAVPIIQKYGVKCATDITGFGLAGHALKMAKASYVSIKIFAEKLPVFEGSMELLNLGCIPGACFRNLEFTENDSLFDPSLSYEHKMLIMDAQTSGGLFICCKSTDADSMVRELREAGFEKTTVVGEVIDLAERSLICGL
ncbi:MAG: selenide, water dikinase SelD [Bacteroidales bacterium]|nr:selenide, water dikinase SelD [Bacteroidales bacterium]